MDDRFSTCERADGWCVYDLTNYNWIKLNVTEEAAKAMAAEWNAAYAYLNSPDAATQ